MFERKSVKVNTAFSGDEGTDSFVLPRGRAISAITLVVRAKNAATHNAPDACEAETVIKAIKKVEIYSGDRVFQSMSGEIIKAFDTYKHGRDNYTNLTQYTGGAYPAGWQEAVFTLDFSRHPMDMGCSLPAPLYDSLSMSIDFDFNTTDANADAAFLTGGANHTFDVYIDVLPIVSREALTNMKVIERKKKLDYSTRATGWDLIDLSISKTKMLRKVLMHCYLAGAPEGGPIDEVEYMLNGKVYATNTWNGWQYRNAQDVGLDFSRTIFTMANSTTDQYYSRIPAAEPQFTAMTTTSEDVVLTVDDDKITMATQTADDLGVLTIDSPVIPATVVMDFDNDLSFRELASMDELKPQIHISNATASGALKVYEETVVNAI